MKTKKRAYLIGIKGVAMTALAVYLKEAGYSVTGSDVSEVFLTDSVLKKADIPVLDGFKKSNIDRGIDVVVATGAHGGMTNIEAVTAGEYKIPVYMHGRYLGKLMENKTGISIAGCHGKTTTSAIIASILSHSKYKPSYLIGTAGINDLGPAGNYGKSKYFVAEADEYMTCPLTDPTPRFLWQTPHILVITNIDYDHPDAYRNLSDVKEAYMKLTKKVSANGVIITSYDDSNVRSLISRFEPECITYGFSPKADFQIENIYFGDGVSFMSIKNRGVKLGEFMLRIPGRHNALNALAASIASHQLGISWEAIRKNLKNYTGCKRRFEKIGDANGINIYDDYAHHPGEIAATISSVREWFPGRKLIIIFQPHTYSRTKVLLDEFAKALSFADKALICDIYPSAREKYDPSINSAILTDRIRKYKNNAIYLKDKQKVLKYISETAVNGDIIMTMGAGDIYQWCNELLKTVRNK